VLFGRGGISGLITTYMPKKSDQQVRHD